MPSGSAWRRRPAGRLKRALKVAALLALITTVALGVTAAAVYAHISKSLPDPAGHMKGRDQTSVIKDRDGRTLVELFAEQNRTDVPLTEMPIELRRAVISTEDKRFYEHKGVDPWGIARAVLVDIRTGSKVQGGSTITQQFVKQAFVTPEKTVKRKVMEGMLAYQVEKRYTKDEILELYLNTIYFGHGAYGVQAASQVYFGKHVGDLTLPESAVLAGVIKAPARFSPYLDEKAAERRRATVLSQMVAENYVDRESYAEALAAELELKGLDRAKARAPYFVEYVKSLLVEEFGADAVYRGGITVKTTLDLKIQEAAERAVRETLNRKGDPSASLVAIDPASGEIVAMVGGRDFGTQQYNVAVQGRRQPGSAFKPFVLVTALQQGISPEATFESGPVRLTVAGSDPWKVTGAGGGRRGPMRLREATERSVNSVFAQLIMAVGPEKVVETARKMGIREEMTPVPAIALGGHEQGVSPLAMASAYGTLANEGVHVRAHGIREVRDATGEVLMKAERKKSRALDPEIAALTTDILKGVVTSGTGKAAAIGRPVAGKTGTTQEYRDAWFVGYTPQLATAVWVGYPEEQREMTNVHGIKVTGGSFPARIWASFMRSALGGEPAKDFAKPEGLKTVSVCTLSGLRAGEYCEETRKALFLAEAVPDACDVHTAPVRIGIPNLVGMTKQAAIAALKKLMLLVKVVERDVAGVAAGIVAEQSPKPGSTGTTETVVTIVVSTGGGNDRPPVARMTVTPEAPSAGEEVAFDGSGSTDDKEVVKWVWEFGDGTKAEGVEVTHRYATPGTYDVVLWVTDDRGQVGTARLSVTVR
ncbi:MAG: PBP1A family penicillin-binding protein [Coriobacteriia bacterium]|nr:PBP1A family penicillin-binding protein [Coriobacteriia bacterium]